MTVRPPSQPPKKPTPKIKRRTFKEKPMEAVKPVRIYRGQPRRGR